MNFTKECGVTNYEKKEVYINKDPAWAWVVLAVLLILFIASLIYFIFLIMKIKKIKIN